MSIETDARQEAERVEQSNDIAYKVIEVARNKAPSEFVTLDFRYGIADALWDAGYRKVEQDTREPSDAEACLVCERTGGTHKMSCRPQNRADAERHRSDEEVEAAVDAIHDHDAESLTCYDHDGTCCPCGKHDMSHAEWAFHRARAALLAAQAVRRG